jgi:hypothetical protein
MTTIQIQLSDATAKAARAAGLLAPQVLDDALTAIAPVFATNWFFVLRKR